MTRLAAVLVALLVVLAGCSAVTTDSPATPTRAGVDTTPVVEDTIQVTVTAVVDGDTIHVEYENGTSDTVRLVGVDTPEVHAENSPGEFEGVPDTAAGESCLADAGADATNFAKSELLGKTVGIATDPNLDRRGYYGRLLAYVVVDGTLFNYQLITTGHARVYDSDFTHSDSFTAAETTARDQQLGLWECADPDGTGDTSERATGTSSLTLADIHADAPGNDHENRNGEYLVFSNSGSSALDLSGWTVTDSAGHSYTFEDATLAGGADLTLYTGSGTDTESSYYWDAETAVWNNGGDTVTVRNSTGAVVLEQAY